MARLPSSASQYGLYSLKRQPNGVRTHRPDEDRKGKRTRGSISRAALGVEGHRPIVPAREPRGGSISDEPSDRGLCAELRHPQARGSGHRGVVCGADDGSREYIGWCKGCKAMRLVVAKYEVDEQHSLDCILCDEDEVEQQFTSLIFYDQERSTSITLCPEHLDEMVTAALKRHKRGISEGNPFWYLDEDKDPWESEDEAHG